ncbi:hypothetical protein [Hymenobacter sp. PAMC 26628]|uniref:hypothetical protein n=1 Tax=Hymenobacter sp. PAMC 26628 TaxID=1484118 RepID=UPI0007701555|nr:hypothetical protein [Hymenobacter sp. PAMC 26628]AMJ65808.1 hypothetical protein AXW84_10490 [Hymenobacter sp. PAMC 26628]
MEFKVLETQQFEEVLLVIYNWMEFSREVPTLNLYAYGLDGGRLWIAEERHSGDFFTGFVGGRKMIRVSTWDCFLCTLDPATGKIVGSEFAK